MNQMNQMNRINQMPGSDRAHRTARLREAVEARYALVHLGVCSAPVALALAAVVTKGSTW